MFEKEALEIINKYKNAQGKLDADGLGKHLIQVSSANPALAAAVLKLIKTRKDLGLTDSSRDLTNTCGVFVDGLSVVQLQTISKNKGGEDLLNEINSGLGCATDAAKATGRCQKLSQASKKIPQNSTNYPPVPPSLPLPTLTNAERLFGTFAYVADPSTHNGRGIKVTDGWDTKNITMISVPQLVGIPIYGVKSSGKMRCHRLVSEQIKKLFQAWEDAGLSNLILNFSGGYTPRFIGKSKTLSNHAFGAAFDINEDWNKQPATPAATGTKGSVRELVPIANELGFYWGGHYNKNPDGMHFEVVVIK